MPASFAWDQGARPGMEILSADGRDLSNSPAGEIPREAFRSATVVSSTGEVLLLEVTQDALGQSPMKFSMWMLGGMFAVVGALVILRRPDLYAARLLGIFLGFTGLALAVAPTSGGPSPQWALILQIFFLVGVGTFFLPFALALQSREGRFKGDATLIVFLALGASILLAYGYSVSVKPLVYQWVRPVQFLFVSASAIGAVAVLAIQGRRRQSPVHRQQAKIALWGIVLSTLPFVTLSLVPEAILQKSLLPNHLTILTWGLLPLSFAYAILQHQMLGIRRLVHRGIVYWTATVVLLTITAAGLSLIVSFVQGSPGDQYSIGTVLGALIIGIAVFLPLKVGVRWLVDRIIYKDSPDYQTLANVVGEDLLQSRETQGVASSLAQGLVQGLRLESVLLFLGDSSNGFTLTAAAGERSAETARHIRSEIESRFGLAQVNELMDLRWGSESLLVVTIRTAEGGIGYLVLGPKWGGEVFLEEEKQVIVAIAPMLSLAIDKSRLSEELREINRRMVDAEETERGRIARDIHDGPLQKAMLIAGAIGDLSGSQSTLARQLASELREVCSRLRPAILDDLGLVPALDWLLDGVLKHSGLSTRLVLDGVLEDERFAPVVELALFRVTQEAANNAMKHSCGDSLTTTLIREEDALVLKVSDDGVGFSQAKRNMGGIGLSSMNERVVQLAGKLEIQSVRGLGTTVIARIPISE